MSKYGEPWEDKPFGAIVDTDGFDIGRFDELEKAMRAVACVDALAHVPGDPAEYVKALEEVVEQVRGVQQFAYTYTKCFVAPLERLDTLRKEAE